MRRCGDVLALSRGMTFKNAVAGTGFGGGKAVIIGTPGEVGQKERMRAFGRAVESLEGRYVTGEDVGIGVQDVDWAGETTRFVTGTSGVGGDPSPFTARGVFDGMKAAMRHRLGTDKLAGRAVMVLGIGKVGWSLCERLYAEGAKLWIADVNAARVEEACARFSAQKADPPGGARSAGGDFRSMRRWRVAHPKPRLRNFRRALWRARPTISWVMGWPMSCFWIAAFFMRPIS